MKASDFIIHLQKMIDEYGDLPLAVLEVNHDTGSYVFIESGEIELYSLDSDDIFLDEYDDVSKERKVFLIDWGCYEWDTTR